MGIGVVAVARRRYHDNSILALFCRSLIGVERRHGPTPFSTSGYAAAPAHHRDKTYTTRRATATHPLRFIQSPSHRSHALRHARHSIVIPNTLKTSACSVLETEKWQLAKQGGKARNGFNGNIHELYTFAAIECATAQLCSDVRPARARFTHVTCHKCVTRAAKTHTCTTSQKFLVALCLRRRQGSAKGVGIHSR